MRSLKPQGFWSRMWDWFKPVEKCGYKCPTPRRTSDYDRDPWSHG